MSLARLNTNGGMWDIPVSTNTQKARARELVRERRRFVGAPAYNALTHHAGETQVFSPLWKVAIFPCFTLADDQSKKERKRSMTAVKLLT